MLQHLLLMMIAPPLLWLGWPLFPLVRGLPEPVRTYWIAPLLRSRPLRSAFAFLTHPFVAWPLYVATTWLWHTPRGYELGLDERQLALRRARLLHRRRPALLVPGRPAVPQPAALAEVAALPVPAARRRAKHRCWPRGSRSRRASSIPIIRKSRGSTASPLSTTSTPPAS